MGRHVCFSHGLEDWDTESGAVMDIHCRRVPPFRLRREEWFDLKGIHPVWLERSAPVSRKVVGDVWTADGIGMKSLVRITWDCWCNHVQALIECRDHFLRGACQV